jgi:hypothetical protein
MWGTGRGSRAVPLALAVLALPGCAGGPIGLAGRGRYRTFRDGSSPAVILQAERNAAPAGARVLAQARSMTVDRHEILPGSCWDYVNAVYTRAGYPGARRRTVFKGGTGGPYAQAEDIQGGDWLYFINHSYNDVEHSSMFVAWADRDALQGWLLSYAGEGRAEPASYKLYRLDSTYQVIRPQD